MKMMCKACILTGLLAAWLVLGARNAHAEFTFFCGENFDKGRDAAEFSFVDSLESSMKVFLAGKEVPEEKLGFKAVAGGIWIVSIDRGPGKGSRKLEFKQGAPAYLTEYSVNEKGAITKVSGQKKCEFRQTPIASPQNSD